MAGGDVPEAPADGPIGWEEFDDISQLEGAAEREYSIEEADATTLAELGLSQQDAPTAEAAEGAPTAKAAARAPRARSPRAKPAGKADEAAPTDEEAPKTRGRAPRARSVAGKTADTAEKDVADGGTSSPARPRTSRPRKAGGDSATSDTSGAAKPSARAGSPSAGSDESEPQGIWGRFRSARRPPTAG